MNTKQYLIAALLFLCSSFCVSNASYAQSTPTTPQSISAIQKSPATLLSQIKKSVKGLIYTSESDSELTAVHWTAESVKNAQTPQEAVLAMVEKLSEKLGEKSPNIQSLDLATFFANATVSQTWWGDEEREQAQKFNHLISVLKKLDGVQVFKVGSGPEKTVYIIGADTKMPGSFTGVTLFVTET